MRILLISWEFPPYVVGGLGRHVAELLTAYRDLADQDDLPEDFVLDVLCTRNGGGPTKERLGANITVYRVDSPPFVSSGPRAANQYQEVMATNSSLINRARVLYRQHKYELIHNHDWLTASASIALKHEWKTPLLTTIHATERGRHQGHLSTEMSRQIDALEGQVCFESWRVIACSGYMRQELGDFFSVPFDKVDVISNGVNFRGLHHCHAETAQAYRKRYSNDGERLLFFVGRITYEKGVQVLINAMPMILNKYPKTRLLVAGKNSEQMWSMAQEMRLGHAVTLLGFINDQQRDYLYQCVDAAIFPSLYEPFGIVALEAMALGCNVIASGVGGLGEIVQHRQNGLTIYPNDPGSIAWAVDTLFSHPQEARQQRRFAEEQAKSLYSWRNIAAQTVSVYQNIVDDRKRVDW